VIVSTLPSLNSTTQNENHTTGVPSHKMLQQAAKWFAIINDEAVTAQQKDAWAHWLKQHPQHRLAWQYVENVGKRFHQTTQLGAQGDVSNTLATVRADRLSRRKLLQGLGGLSAIGWLSWHFTPLPNVARDSIMASRADYHTVTGETREVALQDGGRLWLNTASAINIHYHSDSRQIDLLGGEILIQTSPDTQNRPFIVNTQHGSLQALGTRFAVREYNEATFLAVYDGAVKIQTFSGETQIIKADQQTTFGQHHIQVPSIAERAGEAWVRGLLVANNISLKALIAEVSRYQHAHIAVDPAIAHLRVMGTYPANRPDHVLAMLEDALPIKVNRLLPWWVSLEPKVEKK